MSLSSNELSFLQSTAFAAAAGRQLSLSLRRASLNCHTPQSSVQLDCHTPLSGPCTTWLPRSTLRPMCNQAATLHSQTSVQLDCHAPLSDQWAIKQTRSTLRPVHNLIATLHSQTSGQSSWHSPLSRRLELLHAHCGNSSCCCRCRCCWRPTGSVPHSEPIVSTVRHVTGTGLGFLRKSPEVVFRCLLLLKGTL